MSTATSRVTLQAAPMGRSSGFAAAGDNKESFAVAVLPKIWRSGPPRVHRFEWPESRHLHLTVYENDFLEVDCSTSQHGLVMAAMRTTDESEIGRGMLVPVSSSPADIETAQTISTARLDDVLDLVEISERARWSAESGSVPSGELPHPLLLLMLYRRFLDLTEPIVKNMRSRYSEEEDDLASPRGRITESSLVEAQLGGAPTLRCRYDELTVATDLAKVLLASTRLVATFSGPPVLAALVQPVRRRAARLVRHLNGIPIVNRTVAMRLANGLRLNRLEAIWEPVVELSRRILTGASVSPLPTISHPMQTLAFRIPTDAVWQGILGQAISRLVQREDLFMAGQRQYRLKPEAPQPWGNAGARDSSGLLPDYVAHLTSSNSRNLWVLDAKYKELQANQPSADDASQLFVYSHLVHSDSQTVNRCALLYPTLDQRHNSTPIKLWRRRDNAVQLLLARIQFPVRSDLRHDAAWRTYLGSITGSIRHILSQ